MTENNSKRPDYSVRVFTALRKIYAGVLILANKRTKTWFTFKYFHTKEFLQDKCPELVDTLLWDALFGKKQTH